jgi:gliding motility-associated-like protein
MTIKLATMRCFYLKFLFFFALILSGAMAVAQPINDNCIGAIEISNPRNYCSNAGAFTNVGATTSTVLSVSSCFSANGGDVWFAFQALATDVRVTVQGATALAATGTLRNPEAGIYSGADCSALSELACQSDPRSSNVIEVYKGGLTPGERYYIRVQGGAKRTGTFKLCMINYNPPANITSDCPTSSVLCDKSGFSVALVSGGGTNKTELDDASCFITNGGQRTNLETNSTWFKWTCLQSGTLSFTITPTFLDDDIDFAVYELPNGLNNCTGKKLLRCMAAGETVGGGCKLFGPTGLRDGESDIAEASGCGKGQNNFVKSLDMEAGKSYALGINNFSSTGNGFNLTFGGTGIFQGPEAKINIDRPSKKYCLGDDVLFTDASSFVGGQITNRSWRFGKGASVDTANGKGPFKVFYKTPGWKSVVLTVTSDKGCVVTSILDSIFIEGFKYDSLIRRPTCQLGTDGFIRLKVASCGRPPIKYNWDNTGYSTRDSLVGLGSGKHRVLITDSSGVYVDTVLFNLKQFEIELDTAISKVTPPQCFGLTNGKIELNPKTGVAPFLYKWNNNPTFIPDNKLTTLGDGQYSVEIRDANNCKGFFNFNVNAPPPVGVNVDTFNISCFGKTDGAAIAYPAGGVGKYKVSWSTGTVGDTVRNLKSGNYVLTVRDSNSCETMRSVTINEPPQINLVTIRTQPTKCFGDSTAELVVQGSGGTPPFRYSIDGVRFQKDSAFLKIPAKAYTVVVRDSTGCRQTLEVQVQQPPQLQVSAGPDIEVQLGFSTDIRAIVVPSSKLVSYIWTPKDSSMSCPTCLRTTVSPLRTVQYRVTIKDSTGCTAYDDIIVNVNKKRPIFIPTAFSPNADGVNDYFTIFGNQAAVIIKELRVFNRWGDMLFAATDLPLNVESKGWDGTFKDLKLSPDVFAFFAIIRFIDGEDIIYKGDVTLMR